MLVLSLGTSKLTWVRDRTGDMGPHHDADESEAGLQHHSRRCRRCVRRARLPARGLQSWLELPRDVDPAVLINVLEIPHND